MMRAVAVRKEGSCDSRHPSWCLNMLDNSKAVFDALVLRVGEGQHWGSCYGVLDDATKQGHGGSCDD